MKSRTSIMIGIAAWMISPVFAIEAPVDDSPPPPAVDAESAPAPEIIKPEQAPAPKAEVGYLGVVTREIPEMLAEHLALKPGEGVVVQAVAPDSPAAKAGVANHDIITRIGDKAVASPEELVKLMTSQKPGDVVRLDIIHQGKASVLDITLGARPQVAGEIPGLQLLDGDLALDGMPKEMADRIRDAIQGNLGRFELPLGDPGNADLQQKNIDDLKKRVEEMRANRGNQGRFNLQSNASIRMMDGDGSIEMKATEDGKEFTIRDKDNKVTWTGPWDTEQDKAAAPPDVRKRIERLNIQGMRQGGGMLNFQLGGGLGFDPVDPAEEDNADGNPK